MPVEQPRVVEEAFRGHQLLADELLRQRALVHRQQLLESRGREAGHLADQPDVEEQCLESLRIRLRAERHAVGRRVHHPTNHSAGFEQVERPCDVGPAALAADGRVLDLLAHVLRSVVERPVQEVLLRRASRSVRSRPAGSS